MADRVAVMYAGKIVEYGNVDEIFYNSKHPYTWALLSSMPNVETEEERLDAIPGTPPNLIETPDKLLKGDLFAPRNKYAMQIDLEEEPPYFKVSNTHYAATWYCTQMCQKLNRLLRLSESPDLGRGAETMKTRHQVDYSENIRS